MKKLLITLTVFFLSSTSLYASDMQDNCRTTMDTSSYDLLSSVVTNILFNIGDNLHKKVINKSKEEQVTYFGSLVGVLDSIGSREGLNENQKQIVGLLKDDLVCKKNYILSNQVSIQCDGDVKDKYTSLNLLVNNFNYKYLDDGKTIRPDEGKTSLEYRGKGYIDQLGDALSKSTDGKVYLSFANYKFNQDAYWDKNGTIYTPNSWKNLKFYLPAGTKSFGFVSAGEPSVCQYLAAFTFIYDDDNTAIDNTKSKPRNYYSYHTGNAKMLEEGKTIYYQSSSGYGVYSTTEEILKKGGWVYVSFVNAGYLDGPESSSGDKSACHSEMTSQLSLTIDKDIYNNWKSTITQDDKGEVISNNCVKLIDTSTSGNPIDKKCYKNVSTNELESDTCPSTPPDPDHTCIDGKYYKVVTQKEYYTCGTYPTGK